MCIEKDNNQAGNVAGSYAAVPLFMRKAIEDRIAELIAGQVESMGETLREMPPADIARVETLICWLADYADAERREHLGMTEDQHGRLELAWAILSDINRELSYASVRGQEDEGEPSLVRNFSALPPLHGFADGDDSNGAVLSAATILYGEAFALSCDPSFLRDAFTVARAMIAAVKSPGVYETFLTLAIRVNRSARRDEAEVRKADSGA